MLSHHRHCTLRALSLLIRRRYAPPSWRVRLCISVSGRALDPWCRGIVQAGAASKSNCAWWVCPCTIRKATFVVTWWSSFITSICTGLAIVPPPLFPTSVQQRVIVIILLLWNKNSIFCHSVHIIFLGATTWFLHHHTAYRANPSCRTRQRQPSLISFRG